MDRIDAIDAMDSMGGVAAERGGAGRRALQ